MMMDEGAAVDSWLTSLLAIKKRIKTSMNNVDKKKKKRNEGKEKDQKLLISSREYRERCFFFCLPVFFHIHFSIYLFYLAHINIIISNTTVSAKAFH
jgi:hypothetical protein